MVLVAWTREQRPQWTHWRFLDHPRVRFIRGLPVLCIAAPEIWRVDAIE